MTTSGETGDPCGFPVLINGSLTSITLEFGGRKIVLLPGGRSDAHQDRR
jgi:hypothetical protein